jgi:hypothetical protein
LKSQKFEHLIRRPIFPQRMLRDPSGCAISRQFVSLARGAEVSFGDGPGSCYSVPAMAR